MSKTLKISGYCRISVNAELDKDNTSIENQKSIIEDYVYRTFRDFQDVQAGDLLSRKIFQLYCDGWGDKKLQII